MVVVSHGAYRVVFCQYPAVRIPTFPCQEIISWTLNYLSMSVFQDVGRFDVSMTDAVAVDVVQTSQGLLGRGHKRGGKAATRFVSTLR